MRFRVFLLFLMVAGSALAGISYQGPREVVRFAEQGPSGLGFIREGAGHGPLRLLASDTALYLLARLRHGAYTFDLQGNLLDSVNFGFCPGDMTYDSCGRLHLLQYRALSEYVAAYERGEQTERRELEIPEGQPMKEVGISPRGRVLVLSGGYTYRIVEGERENRLMAWGERTGRFHLTDTHIERLKGTWEARFTARTEEDSIPPVNLHPLGWEVFQFHADDRKGRAYIVGTSIQENQEGERYLARRLLVTRDGQLLTQIKGLRAGHPSYDYANHDIAVSPSGDVYLFRSNNSKGFSRILHWELSE